MVQRQLLLREGEVSVAGWTIPVERPYDLDDDEQGRYRCWAILMATPGLYYHGEWQDWPLEDLQALKDHQDRQLSIGYEIPLIILHDEKATEGRRKGHLGAFELVKGSDGETYLLGVVTFTEPDARELHRRGEYRYVSCGIDAYWDDTGYTVPFGIYEVSLTPRPWQKRFGPTHLLKEDAMGKKANETATDAATDPKTQLAEPSADAPGSTGTPEPVAENDGAAAMISALVAEVASLRGRVEALEARAAGTMADQEPTAPAPAMMAEVCRRLGLSEGDTGSALALAKTDPTEALNLIFRLAPKTSNTPSWSRQGSPTQPPAAKKTKATLYAECLAAADGDAVKALNLYQAGLKSGNIQE